MDLRALRMVDIRNRYFPHRETHGVGEIQHLGIKSPARDLLPGKDCLAGSLRECFETVLCILEVQAKYRTQQQVINAPIQTPVPRLRHVLQISVDPPRANRNVGAMGQRFNQNVRVFDGSGIVRVSKKNDVAGGAKHPIPNSSPLTAIYRVVDEQQWDVSASELPHHCRGVIPRTVIYDDDLRFPLSRVNKMQDLFQRPGNSLGFVICRDHNTERGSQGAHKMLAVPFAVALWVGAGEGQNTLAALTSRGYGRPGRMLRILSLLDQTVFPLDISIHGLRLAFSFSYSQHKQNNG